MHAPAPSMDGVFPLPSPRDSAPEASAPAPHDDLSSNEQGDAPAAEAAPLPPSFTARLLAEEGARVTVLESADSPALREKADSLSRACFSSGPLPAMSSWNSTPHWRSRATASNTCVRFFC